MFVCLFALEIMRHLFHCNWGQMAATYLAIYYRMLSVHNDLPRGRHHERWHLRRCQFALGRSPRGQGCSHASFFLLSFFLFFLLSFFLSSFFSFGGAIVKDSYRGICCFSASLLLCFSLLLSAGGTLNPAPPPLFTLSLASRLAIAGRVYLDF